MHFTELDASQHAHWAAFPYALEAIADFMQEHDPHREPVSFLQSVRDAWTQSHPSCGIFLWHRSAKDLFPIDGHLLLTAESDSDGPFAHIWQANIEPYIASYPTRDFMDACLEECRAWARKRNLPRLCHVTSRNPDAYVRRYGFTKLRTWLGMEVGDGSC